MAGSPQAVSAAGARNASPGPPRGPPMGYLPPPPQVPGSGPRYSAPPFPTGARPTMFRPMALPPSTGSGPRPPPMGGMRPIPVLKPPVMPDQAKVFGGPYEKPYTTVYVGKIASSVDDTFLRSILQLCGPIKSWKRAHDPTIGGPKGFGFCEFETAEGVLRALRLLNKYNLDGQELVLNVNKDTREYLERYVAGKENDKLLEEVAQEEDIESAPGVEVARKKTDQGDNTKAFGIVSEVDKKGDEDALARLKTLFDERVRCRPLYRPLILDGRSPSTRERSKDLDDLSGRNEEDNSSDRLEKMETSSSDRVRRDVHHRDDERLDRERDRERPRHNNNNNNKDRKHQHQHQQHQHQHRDTERVYEEHEREWEAREREKERQRLHDRERERERERERRREVKEQEDESDNEGKKKRYRPEERRRRRQREREDDIADAIRETEEIAEAKRRKLEQEMQVAEEEKVEADESREDVKMDIDSETEAPSVNGDSEAVSAEAARNDPEAKPIPKKLGFGISTGKRASLPSLFHQPDEEELLDDRKLRPLVPIDYSVEEMQAVRTKRSPSPEEDRREGRRRSRRDRDRDRDKDRDDSAANPKVMDAKQLIDSIPKSKDELFNYPINWAIYDKHKVHEKMKPWISKKITVFLGEEETSFVDFIVSNTCKHVSAAEMLEKLKSILDEEAEMFVLKMWRMLIFEIRRIETGLAKTNP